MASGCWDSPARMRRFVKPKGKGPRFFLVVRIHPPRVIASPVSRGYLPSVAIRVGSTPLQSTPLQPLMVLNCPESTFEVTNGCLWYGCVFLVRIPFLGFVSTGNPKGNDLGWFPYDRHAHMSHGRNTPGLWVAALDPLGY